MSEPTEVRSAMAVLALNCLPPSLRETLARDVRMRDAYGIQIDTIFSVGDSDFQANVSAVVRGVSRALCHDPGATVTDVGGGDWSVDYSTDRNGPGLWLVHGDRRVEMHAWLVLAPDSKTRLQCLKAFAGDAGLPPKARSSWRRILDERSLEGEEVLDFIVDLHSTPPVQEHLLARAVRSSGLASQLAAPPSRTYFERLVGSRGDSASIQRHAETGARERLAELAAWRPYQGFLQSLYMASHPSVSAQIRVEQLSSRELADAFEFLLRWGDPVSQLAAIEVGFRVAADRPEVKPLLIRLVDHVRNDDTSRRTSAFRLYSLLYILVSSELSTRQQLASEPPFYRRVAALAQAGVIQRQMAAAGIRLEKSALELVAGSYYVQALVDLRLEPKRHPTLATAQKLKAHVLSRVLRAAGRHGSEMDAELIEELEHVLGPESLRQAGEAFVLYSPGPLEAWEESRPLPAAFARAIEVQLDTDRPVEPVDFSALTTSATSFRVEKAQAALAAAGLRRCEHRLANVKSRSELVATLADLAAVAAMARSEPLADTLNVVVRNYRRDPEFPVGVSDAMQILLTAAASRAELGAWADFVGDCLTEFAFGDLAAGEGQLLHGYVRRLCELVPELWATCGRADAALSAFNRRLTK